MKYNEDIDRSIDGILEFMKGKKPDSEEYIKGVRTLKELYDIKSQIIRTRNETYETMSKLYESKAKIIEARNKKDSNVMQVLAIVIPATTSILGIGMILFREELHPVTSKALQFVFRRF